MSESARDMQTELAGKVLPRGGLDYSGMEDQPATRTDKEWWVQWELLAALTDGLKHEACSSYLDAPGRSDPCFCVHR